MMRLVMMGAAAFLLSLAGTTGALVMKAKAAHPVVADSAAQADSATARADSTELHGEPAGTLPDSSPAHADSGATTVARGGSAGPAPATDALGATPAVTAPAAPAPTATAAREQAAYKQLARIFANMKTADAAKVLAYMSDGEVQGVLQQLGVRPAAGLLAALPKERAAALSRRLLASGKEDPKP